MSRSAIHRPKTHALVTGHDRPDRGGVSMSPPDYGIEFVDHRAEPSAQPSAPIQMRAGRWVCAGQGQPAGASIHEVARSGLRGGGRSLPHLAAVERSFGGHDLGHVKAYTGPRAAAACDRIGAEAYASGNAIAFRSPNPSLHTVAHEAAHVVQQQRGVRLQSNVGRTGDAYERHADRVADTVVRGGSAQALLAQSPGPGSSAGTQPSVQLKWNHRGGDNWQWDELVRGLRWTCKDDPRVGMQYRFDIVIPQLAPPTANAIAGRWGIYSALLDRLNDERAMPEVKGNVSSARQRYKIRKKTHLPLLQRVIRERLNGLYPAELTEPLYLSLEDSETYDSIYQKLQQVALAENVPLQPTDANVVAQQPRERTNGVNLKGFLKTLVLLSKTTRWAGGDSVFFHMWVQGGCIVDARMGGTINCWEAVLIAAFYNGLVTVQDLQQAYDTTHQRDVTMSVWALLSRFLRGSIFHPAPGPNDMRAGDIIMHERAVGLSQASMGKTTPLDHVGIVKRANTNDYRDVMTLSLFDRGKANSGSMWVSFLSDWLIDVDKNDQSTREWDEFEHVRYGSF